MKKSRANKVKAAATTDAPVNDAAPVDAVADASPVSTVAADATTVGAPVADATDTTDTTDTTDAPEEGKKGKVPVSRTFKADGSVLMIGNTAQSCVDYVNAFNAVTPEIGSGGYTSFVTKADAFTNRKMIRSFTANGIAKMMALLLDRAAQVILEGGEKGKEMSDALTGLNAFQSVAIANAKQTRERNVMDDAIRSIATARGCTIEEARKQLAAFANTSSAPAATVTATEPTLKESDAAIEADADVDADKELANA